MDKRTMSDARVDNGGPAFPQSDLSAYGIGPHDGPQAGMSLRDWFAGQALAGSCANPGLAPMSEDELAQACYAQADAMLRAGSAAWRKC